MALVEALRGVTRDFSGHQALKQLAREVRWAGNAVRCPCCGWRGRAFRPSCEDRPGVPLLCARCTSGPNDRAIWLILRSLTPSLPMGARILDVEPSTYTRLWFDRFNQFDYRTLGRSTRDVDIEGDLTSVTITKGICHLILCARGIDRDLDLMATVLSLFRLSGDDGTVLVRVGDDSGSEVSTTGMRQALKEVGFAVNVLNLTQRVTPEVAQRYGLVGAAPVLVAAPVRPHSGTRAARSHGHSHL
jgi:hypothetical protein